MIRHQCPHPYHQTKKRRATEKYTAIVVIVGFLVLFALGRFSVKSVDAYQIENALLQTEVVTLTQENITLVKQQDFVESSKKIDEQARHESRKSLTKLHDELSEVKKQLAFYQRVLAPETLTKGLYINSFEIRPISDRGYGYQLILAQGGGKKRAIKGRYSVVITGVLNGQEKTVSVEGVPTKKDQSKNFSFRYYESLTGSINLAEGFMPKDVQLVVKPSTKGVKALKQHWLWQDTLLGDAEDTRH